LTNGQPQQKVKTGEQKKTAFTPSTPGPLFSARHSTSSDKQGQQTSNELNRQEKNNAC